MRLSRNDASRMSGTSTTSELHTACPSCQAPVRPETKFCLQCGQPLKDSFGRHTVIRPPARHNHQIPDFAVLGPRLLSAAAGDDISQEERVCAMLLWRERLLLVVHWLMFLGLQLAGLTLALQCYSGFIGDELTKLWMAGTPLLYINTTAMLCIIPIKAARREISRLKNKLAYLRFKVEYEYLFS